MIIVYNSLFYMITPPLIAMIGQHLMTDETRTVAVAITFILLVDFVVLPLMIGMNLVEYTLDDDDNYANRKSSILWYL